MGQGGEEQKVALKIVPFSISVLAVVTNKVETAMSFRISTRGLAQTWLGHATLRDQSLQAHRQAQASGRRPFASTGVTVHF